MTESIATDFRTIDGLPGSIVETNDLVADDVVIVVMKTAFVVGIVHSHRRIVVPSRWDENFETMIELDEIGNIVVLRVDPREFGFISHFMTPRALSFYAARRAATVIGEKIERSDEGDFAVRYSIGHYGANVNRVTAESTNIERIIDADMNRAI